MSLDHTSGPQAQGSHNVPVSQRIRPRLVQPHADAEAQIGAGTAAGMAASTHTGDGTCTCGEPCREPPTEPLLCDHLRIPSLLWHATCIYVFIECSELISTKVRVTVGQGRSARPRRVSAVSVPSCYFIADFWDAMAASSCTLVAAMSFWLALSVRSHRTSADKHGDRVHRRPANMNRSAGSCPDL